MNYLLIAAFLTMAPLQHGAIQPADSSHLPFYQVTKPGSLDTSYIFGTLHLLEGGYVDTMQRLIAALTRADVVVGELVLDSAITGDALQGLLGGPPLDSVLTTKQYHLVSEAVKKYSPVPLLLINNAEPIILYSMIMEGMYEEAHPENHKTGIPMDLYFQQEAQKNGRQVIGLEAAQDQEQVIDSLPIHEQIEELMGLLDDPKTAMLQMDTMLTEYREGKITEILDDPSFGAISPDEMSSLLYDRNKKWLNELPTIIDHHHAFIAVGAGHLAGEKGIIEGLRKLGYNVHSESTF